MVIIYFAGKCRAGGIKPEAAGWEKERRRWTAETERESDGL